MLPREVLKRLEDLSDPEAVEGMARFGIRPDKAFGVSIPELRKLAKEIGTDHRLALRLWAAGYRETRILASMIDDPALVAEEQAGSWVRDFTYWEICDQCCMNLLEDTGFAYRKCVEWAASREEFVKRASFVLMARLAVSDKKADDDEFLKFLPLIKREASDERNFVRKAVNWALRQIGKRSLKLNGSAIKTAREVQAIDSRSAKWIASDALRELESEPVQERLRRKK